MWIYRFPLTMYKKSYIITTEAANFSIFYSSLDQSWPYDLPSRWCSKIEKN